jgi:hypothetical protein
MIRRLEQVVALVVAAGLALVSYWLFFSWARGGGAEHRLPGRSRSLLLAPPPALLALGAGEGDSKSAAGLQQPPVGGPIVEALQVGLHQLGRDGQALGLADGHDA